MGGESAIGHQSSQALCVRCNPRRRHPSSALVRSGGRLVEHAGGANANIVPTVANGHVSVASFWQLRIFGLRPPTAEPMAAVAPPIPRPAAPPPPPGVGQFWGTVKSIDGPRMTLELRTGRLLHVDLSSAIKEHRVTPISVGQPARVIGRMSASGVFEASSVIRAKGYTRWGEDRGP